MARSTGKRLQEARLVRGLSLEDVQHLTRIRLAQLAGMENEDLTVFPSPSYARGFYALYGRFLGVDLTAFLETLESARLKPVKYHQYLRPSTDRVSRGRHSRARHLQPLPHAGRLALLALALALLVGAAAWVGNPQWHRHTQANTRTPADSVADRFPLLIGTSRTPPAAEPGAGQFATERTDSASGSLTQVDVRTTPPPVLKALPVDDANTRGNPGAEGSKDRQPVPEVRRPAPFTR